MLIIFDLDDTLIDTSVSVTPIKLNDAFFRMMEEGMPIQDISQSLSILQRINAQAESSKSAIAEFLEIHDLDARFLAVGVKAMYEDFSDDINVSPLPGALEILQEFSQMHQLAVVTGGTESQQRAKMKKAGIDFSFFSKVVVSPDNSKKAHYQAIVEELGFDPKDVVVCGDRIQRDLTPAKALGITTIHMRFGRGIYSHGDTSDVDYSISNLYELQGIIQQITELSSSILEKPW